jgi:membrane protease YdiL (CAAX protease family)
MLAGLLSGVAIFAVIGGAFLLLGSSLVSTADVQEMAGNTGLSSRAMYLGCAAYWICVNSVLEEYVWRWFVFARLAELMPTRWAVAAAALAFTLHHIAAITVYLPGTTAFLATAGILVGALIWSWLYARYRSIWPGYLSHVGADLAIFVIGYHLIFAS